jgi:hypothetical protein
VALKMLYDNQRLRYKIDGTTASTYDFINQEKIPGARVRHAFARWISPAWPWPRFRARGGIVPAPVCTCGCLCVNVCGFLCVFVCVCCCENGESESESASARERESARARLVSGNDGANGKMLVLKLHDKNKP